jgi:hypothetical protein
MSISSSEIKRQILMSAGQSDIKKRMENPPGISDGELLEIGNDLKSVTKMRGWIWIESYMFRRMNLVGLVLSDKDQPDQKGIARGYIELMQVIQLHIQKAEEIEEKERLKYAKTETVPEDEGK